LTAREIEVLQSLALGLSDKEIAVHLSVSPKTVRVHMANILDKLDRTSRLQALIFAVQHDIVRLT
jgi:two-component system nitrate/nitrite response regulator NarL